MSKRTLTVTTPHGTFSRGTASAYTHAVVSEPVGRHNMTGTPDELRAQIVTYLGKGGVFGRVAKDNGYIVSWHGSEAAARKAAEKGNSPYFQTRTLGVYPVDAAQDEPSFDPLLHCARLDNEDSGTEF